MKTITRILLLLLLTVGVTSLYSQTDKGTWTFSGGTSIGFASLSDKCTYDPATGDKKEWNGPKYSILDASVSGGYFIMNNFAFGLNLGYNSTTIKQEEDTEVGIDKWESKESGYRVGPFAKFYFGQDNIKPFVGGGAGIGKTKSEYTESDARSSQDKMETSLFYWEVFGGVAFMINDYVSFNLAAGYGVDQDKYDNTDADYTVTTKTGGVQVLAGFTVYLH